MGGCISLMGRLTIGSMFAGVGGICLGFKEAGCDVRWANDFDVNCSKTYQHNFPDTSFIEGDIGSMSTDIFEPVDIITSGFPCQAFSVAGYRNGFQDHRGNLFFETARFIHALKPKAYLLENVKNLKYHDHGNTLQVIRDTLVTGLGYSFQSFVLNAKDFNVPQTRERLYMVGFREDIKHNFQIPPAIPLTRSIHDCISDMPVEERFYYREHSKIYPHLEAQVINPDTLYQWRRKYVRENKSNLCPTLTANMGTGGHNVPILRTRTEEIRKLTPRECFNFQGFPDSFQLPDQVAITQQYKQAGNSVVVPVITPIAQQLILSI